jgi:aspartate/methionine/tyrosine aminotransferase
LNDVFLSRFFACLADDLLVDQSSMAPKQSEFLHWAKVRPKAKYDLALSGILNLPLRELDVKASELDLHGDNAYGYAPLVDALAEHCAISQECVVTISGGTSMANHLAMAAVVEPGDEVLIEQPTYEPILALAAYFGARIKRFARPFEHSYQIDIEDLEKQITPRTRLICLTNLHNPSSALADDATLRQIGDLAQRVGARVLVDEVYLESMFAAAPNSAALLGPQFIAASSLTKGYGLSGLRCGWILAEPELADRMRRLNDIFGGIGPFLMDQLSVVAITALPKITERAQNILETNRARLHEFFARRDDVEVVKTQFGTTSFPRLRNVNVDALCQLLIKKYETAVVPGRFFESPEHIRIGMCCDTELFRTGLERVGRALDEL